VHAARALGASSGRIVIRHILPTAMPAVVVQSTLGMAGAIIAEASLSFLGLGVQPPTPSWGTMLDAGRSHLFDAPHLTIFPGMAIAILVLGFNFLGDGLRDRVDRSWRLRRGDSHSTRSRRQPRALTHGPTEATEPKVRAFVLSGLRRTQIRWSRGGSSCHEPAAGSKFSGRWARVARSRRWCS
jgi:hypothetical protein